MPQVRTRRKTLICEQHKIQNVRKYLFLIYLIREYVNFLQANNVLNKVPQKPLKEWLLETKTRFEMRD